MFVKLPKEANGVSTFTKTLVNVCAWCPRGEYPELKNSEEYSHGLCEKHYRMLTAKHKSH